MGKNELNIDWSGFFRSWADAEQNFSNQTPIASPISTCAQGTPVQRDIAKIFKKPSPSQKQEIETLIRKEHYQQAIDKSLNIMVLTLKMYNLITVKSSFSIKIVMGIKKMNQ